MNDCDSLNEMETDEWRVAVKRFEVGRGDRMRKDSHERGSETAE